MQRYSFDKPHWGTNQSYNVPDVWSSDFMLHTEDIRLLLHLTDSELSFWEQYMFNVGSTRVSGYIMISSLDDDTLYKLLNLFDKAIDLGHAKKKLSRMKINNWSHFLKSWYLGRKDL